MFRAMGQAQAGQYGEQRNGGICLYDEAFDAIPACQSWEDGIPEHCWLGENMENAECQAWGEQHKPPHIICEELALLRWLGSVSGDPTAAAEMQMARDMVLYAPSCSGREREKPVSKGLMIGAAVGVTVLLGLGIYVATKKGK